MEKRMWDQLVCCLENRFGETTVSAWLDEVQVMGFLGETLVLYTPSAFRREVIQKKCVSSMEEILGKLSHRAWKVVVWGDGERIAQGHKIPEPPQPFCPVEPFTYDHMIVGTSNELAVRTAKSLPDSLAEDSCNPLYILGPSGVGKTHLLYAAANDIQSQMPDKKIIYIKAEQFTEELVAALLNDTLEKFKEQYLKADVLLMDDLQYVLDKPSTLEELRRLFGRMLQQKKQVVIVANPGSGSRPTLKQLQDSFDTGFAVEIAPPDREMRMALVQAEAEKYDLPLTEETVACLADRLTGSLERIRRGMKKICADHICNGMELGLEKIAGVMPEL